MRRICFIASPPLSTLPPARPPARQQPLSIHCAIASPLPALHSTAFSLLLSLLLTQLAEEESLRHHFNSFSLVWNCGKVNLPRKHTNTHSSVDICNEHAYLNPGVFCLNSAPGESQVDFLCRKPCMCGTDSKNIKSKSSSIFLFSAYSKKINRRCFSYES